MEVEEVRARVEAIKRISGDDEVAHSREDALHQEVLRAIAEGSPEAAELGQLSLPRLCLDVEKEKKG